MGNPQSNHQHLNAQGATRFINVPGVYYPQKVLKINPHHFKKDGTLFTEVPSWGITTKEAAIILQSSPSAARVFLKRKGVMHRIVHRRATPPTTFWNREEVRELAEKKPPIINMGETPNLLTPNEAADLLGIGRSTIQRAMSSKLLHPIIVRIDSDQGPRKRNLLRVAELKKFGRTLRARHLRELERRREALELEHLLDDDDNNLENIT